jgi:hypothetical protein
LSAFACPVAAYMREFKIEQSVLSFYSLCHISLILNYFQRTTGHEKALNKMSLKEDGSKIVKAFKLAFSLVYLPFIFS